METTYPIVADGARWPQVRLSPLVPGQRLAYEFARTLVRWRIEWEDWEPIPIGPPEGAGVLLPELWYGACAQARVFILHQQVWRDEIVYMTRAEIMNNFNSL